MLRLKNFGWIGVTLSTLILITVLSLLWGQYPIDFHTFIGYMFGRQRQ